MVGPVELGRRPRMARNAVAIAVVVALAVGVLYCNWHVYRKAQTMRASAYDWRACLFLRSLYSAMAEYKVENGCWPGKTDSILQGIQVPETAGGTRTSETMLRELWDACEFTTKDDEGPVIARVPCRLRVTHAGRRCRWQVLYADGVVNYAVDNGRE